LKVRQSHALLEFLEGFLKKSKKIFATPLVIAGDFNSMPNSAVYELYSTGSVLSKHVDFTEDRDSRTSWTQRFELQSSYSVLNEPITNYTPDFKAYVELVDFILIHDYSAIDYMWFSKQTLELSAILDTIPIHELQKTVSLPTPLWSSDHIALVSDFEYK
jgi:CCR4-NOT transcription complex subunit 6